MLEWLKRHAWKACILQKGIRSSNLLLSANRKKKISVQVNLTLIFFFGLHRPAAGGGRCRSASERNLGEKEVRRTAYGRCRSDSERNLGEKEARRAAYGRCRSDSERNLGEKEVRRTTYGLGRSSLTTTC